MTRAVDGDGAARSSSTAARSRRRYFSSSSGGATVSAAEATGKPVPYLVSVPDPYDTLSPNHDWGPVSFDAAKVGEGAQAGRAGCSTCRPTAGPSGATTRP